MLGVERGVELLALAPTASVARARCSALLTEATVVSSSSATSAACQRSTSHRISTERWRAGQVLEGGDEGQADRLPSGGHVGRVAVGGDDPLVGDGLHPRVLGLRVAEHGVGDVVDGPISMGRARRWGLRCMSTQTLLAMRYSHDRSDERPSKPSIDRQARTIVSWTASSASEPEPSIR